MRRAGFLQRDRLAPPLARPPVRLSRIAGSILILFGLGAALFITATVGVQLAFSERIPSGVQVLNVDVSGRTRAEARGLLQAAASSLLRQPVVLRVGERQWESTPRELGMQIDTNALVDQAYGVGREGSVFDRIG